MAGPGTLAPECTACRRKRQAARQVAESAPGDYDYGDKLAGDVSIQPRVNRVETQKTFPFQNPDLPLDARVDDLVSRLTLAEKAAQMLHEAPAIERLEIPPYNWWNECLHGVARAGVATVFPQAIGLAATWNTALHRRIAEVISDEARAKHHQAVQQGDYGRYKGLTFWSPNINIFRDPRWGRGQETYGEDPYLTAQMGIAFVEGLQGDDPRYLKVAACAKHYAVHSGPEADRHHFDARVTPRELWDTYLPAFEALVRAARVEIVMGAYNRTNGEPCCASPTLLGQILRERWGFEGHVTSDCWAIADLYKHHRVVETREQAAALAVNHGCDLNCGCTYDALPAAVEAGLIDEATIDRSLRRLFRTRFRLGMFDPPERVAYAQVPASVNDAPEHRALARQAAREAIVLLKNEGGLLPLDPALKTLAVIGPNADDAEVMWGNYNGIPSRSVTPLEGIRARVSPQTQVLFAQGCDLLDPATDGFAEALDVAQRADVVIFVGGISQRVESEEEVIDGVPRGDRESIGLPAVQESLLRQLHALGKPIVLVLLNGGPLSIPWADAHLPAILEAWYPGEEGGAAIADVLFGDYNPAGRLPVTVYRSLDDLPPFDDYHLPGRTYRYFDGLPLYPFGYGLSYTRFAYRGLRVDAKRFAVGEPVTVTVEVENVGARAGDEVVQVYLRALDAPDYAPRHSLQAFRRIHLEPGAAQRVTFTLDGRQFSLVDEDGARWIRPGKYEIFAGGGQPGFAETVSATITLSGEPAICTHLYGPA